MLCFCIACFSFITWAPACWEEILSIESVKVNQYISLFAVISIPVTIFYGALMDHIPKKCFGVISSLGYAAIVGIAFLLPKAEFLLPYVLAYPFFEGAVSTCLWTIIPMTARNETQTPAALALFNFFSNLGMLAGLPIVGFVVDMFGWTMASILLLTIMLAGLALISMARFQEIQKIS